MITRIVRMSFQEDKTDLFLKIFESSKEKIRAFEGCEELSLHQDYHHKNIFYTISIWTSQAQLDVYRKSELFKHTWTKTKSLFNDKPQAFSLEKRL